MNLPIELFPEQEDVERIMHLYSIDSLNDVDNPDQRVRIHSFWKKSILGHCLYHKSLLITLDTLKSSFEIFDVEPTSLLPAYKTMISNREITSMSDNKSQTTFEVTLSWIRFIGSYALSILEEDITSQLMIYLPVVKLLVETILLKYAATLSKADKCFYLKSNINNSSSNIMYNNIDANSSSSSSGNKKNAQPATGLTFRDFVHQAALYHQSQFQSSYIHVYATQCLLGLNDKELMILADYMINQKKASILDLENSIIYIHSDTNLTITTTASSSSSSAVKSQRHMNTSNSISVSATGEIAMAFLKIRYSIVSVQRRIQSLEMKITNHLISAKNYKLKGDTKMALTQLHLRRTAAEARDRLGASLCTLTEALERMEGMADLVLIRDAYIAATLGLQSQRQQSGLTVESAEEAQQLFAEEVELTSDIEAILYSSSNDTSADTSREEEAQLLQELAEIMNETVIVTDTSNTATLIPSNIPTPVSTMMIKKPVISAPAELVPADSVFNAITEERIHSQPLIVSVAESDSTTSENSSVMNSASIACVTMTSTNMPHNTSSNNNANVDDASNYEDLLPDLANMTLTALPSTIPLKTDETTTSSSSSHSESIHSTQRIMAPAM